MERIERVLGWLARVFSSGVFFMVVGAVILSAAYYTMGDTHSSFSFVLVVIGIAILLYGTGTQGAGQFSSEAESAKYKVAIAGGAGILAFCVGAGILYFADQIKTAFQIEKRYFRYLVKSDDENFADLSNYVALANVNGEMVPALTRGGQIEVYVPYFLSTQDVEISGTAWLYRIKPGLSQLEHLPAPFTIQIPAKEVIRNADGGYDFPVYRKQIMRVSIREAVRPDVGQLDESQAGSGPLPPPVTVGAQ